MGIMISEKQSELKTIENVWKHSKHVVCSVWFKSGVLKLMLKIIPIIWEFISTKYMSLGRNCYSSRFTFVVVNWSNTEYDMIV